MKVGDLVRYTEYTSIHDRRKTGVGVITGIIGWEPGMPPCQQLVQVLWSKQVAATQAYTLYLEVVNEGG